MKSFRVPLFIILLATAHLSATASDITQNYINRYRDIAISEMQRVGIPASIKMAQAILESNSGRSTLARQSNNHFGIKCGKSWTGREVYYEDDDYDEDGLLTRSCFRAFDDPAESFYEHSEFLANPYSKRYKFLFQLDAYDYEAWAKGLKKAGYATDPAYPKKLINVIEKYRLYELDLGIISEDEYREQIAAHDIQSPVIINDSSEDHPGENKSISALPKKLSKVGYYRVKRGETIRSIADAHGIDVRTLYLRNRLQLGAQPQVGEELALHKTIHFKKKPRRSVVTDASSLLWEESIVISK